MAKETETLNGQTFDVLEPEDRPRDTYGDCRSLRFITSDLPPKKWTGLGRHTLSESWADITQGRM
jgi:hypothetical protein